MNDVAAHSADDPQFLWFLPSYGDSRYIGSTQFRRQPDLPYLRSVAQAVDHLGYHGALLPTGGCDDSWIIASALVEATRRMRFLVAVRPGTVAPVVAARMAATFDRISGGRLGINVVPGDNQALLEDGLTLASSDRYILAHEWTSALRRLLHGESVTIDGQFVQLNNASLDILPIDPARISLYFGGSSKQALDVAAQHCDFYLSWGEPPKQVGEKIAQVRTLAQAAGRSMRFGLRVHVIVRETDEEAQLDADRLISRVSDSDIAKAQLEISQSDSVGRARMRDLHNGDRSRVWQQKGLWSGIGLVRGGAGTALVGSAATVKAVISEYQAVGVDTFVLSGYPHLEEAHRFAELVLPEFRRPRVAAHRPSSATLGAVQF